MLFIKGDVYFVGMEKSTRKLPPLYRAVLNPSFMEIKIRVHVKKHENFKNAILKYGGSKKDVSAITRTLMEQFTEGVNSGILKKGF